MLNTTTELNGLLLHGTASNFKRRILTVVPNENQAFQKISNQEVVKEISSYLV